VTDLALDIRGLSKTYRGFALREVTFALPRGYVMGLIGPNGAGKSTIVKLLMNLVTREAGEVLVFGQDARAAERAVKARIGFVYDEPHYYDDATLEDHRRAFAPFYPRWDDAAFDRLARRFELPRDRRFGRLSKGMKTKFALLLALCHGADLLVLDEPTSGLDPVFRREFVDLVAEVLQDEGKSVLFSTHITTDLERIADFVTLVDGGRVVFSLGRDELAAGWGLVKGDASVIDAVAPAARRGVRRGAYGVEVLTSDAAAARRAVGTGAIVERASLDDIMVLMAREGGHAA
jgi:ABC-2 type transport system ATP-binding protein